MCFRHTQKRKKKTQSHKRGETTKKGSPLPFDPHEGRMDQWTVALLTDFGPGSEYVGVVKGVLLKAFAAQPHAAAPATIVDLCHTIAPQAVVSGAWVLRSARPHYPARTVFLCVVDPGVGSARRALAVFFDRPGTPVFVGPDNGLLWQAVADTAAATGARALVAVLPTENAASRTFHGRDVFAPAAAAAVLCRGDHRAFAAALRVPALRVVPLAEMVVLDLGSRTTTDGAGVCTVQGVVVLVDHYGNVVTSAEAPGGGGTWRVRCVVERGAGQDALVLEGLHLRQTYAEGRPGELFVITGSSGTLELSVTNGDATKALAPAHIPLGSQITFQLTPQ